MDEIVELDEMVPSVPGPAATCRDLWVPLTTVGSTEQSLCQALDKKSDSFFLQDEK